MKRVTTRKDIVVPIEYSVGRQDVERGYFEVSVPDPKFLDEIRVNTSEDMVWDDDGKVVPTGKIQVNLRGSRRAYREFARYLLALAELESLDPDHHDHFDEILDNTGSPAIHLIAHAPRN